MLRDYYNTGDAGESDLIGVWDTTYLAQVFTAEGTYTATSVKLKLCNADVGGSLTASLRATDAGHLPTGADLCSKTIDGSTITTDPYGEWVEFTFTSPVELTGGLTYAVVLHAPTGMFAWRFDASGLSEYPWSICSSDGGENWAWDYGIDGGVTYMFEVDDASTTTHEISSSLTGTSSLISVLALISSIACTLISTGSFAANLIKLFKTNTTATKIRLIAAGSNQIWIEDI